MSTVERKEYKETKIMRTVSPTRNLRSSTQNLAEFDHNLDNMLEDLQNSVSRPGSSLGQPLTNTRSTTLESTRNNNILNRYNHVKSSNPVEYSSDDAYDYTSPDGTKRIAGYKKESYMYRTEGGTGSTQARTQNSINQLDSLLDDLQQVKNSSFIDNSYNSTGLDPDFQGNKVASTKRTVQRELHYGDTPRSSSRSRTLERTERESSLTRDVQYTQEGTYGDLRPIRNISPSPSSRTSTLSKQTKVTNIHQYPVEVVETTSPEITSEVLAHLDPSLHPPGNTKVTTTIKTYTYEIPGSGPYPTTLDTTVDSEKYVYSPNQSQTTPSKSFIYNKYENKENTQINYQQPPPPPPPQQETRFENRVYRETTDKSTTTNYQPYQKPPPPVPTGHTIVKETVTTRNYQPGGYQPDIPVNNQTYVYNETVRTRNINNDNYYKPPPVVQQPPPDTFIIEENHNTITNRNISQPYPPPVVQQPPPPKQTTYIVEENHNTITNRNINQPYPPDNYNRPPYHPNDNKTVIYRHETHTTNNYGPDYGDGNGKRPSTDVEIFDPRNPPTTTTTTTGRKPNEPNVNIQYKYKSEMRTTNNYKTGYPPSEETQNLLPRPFPTESQPNGNGPPKRLDELMANIGNEPPNSPYNASFNAHEHELEQKKKIESLKQQQADVVDNEVQRKEPIQRSKNVSGPPVYYPPNHEMFLKKEEGGGAWRAEGAYARESGKYQYEAESKSKTKSSSGAAIVPVCLPLCCGLPCTII